MASPVCSHCGRRFDDRRSLLVLSIGRGSLAGVHEGCRRAYMSSLPGFLRGAGAVNRPTAILWVLGFNMLFGGWWLIARPGDRTGIGCAWGLMNAFLLVQRFLAWWCYERHVPLRPDHR